MPRKMFVPALWPLLPAGSCSRPCVVSFSIDEISVRLGSGFGGVGHRVMKPYLASPSLKDPSVAMVMWVGLGVCVCSCIGVSIRVLLLMCIATWAEW